jgi:N,N'-diacetyllegionaminate synthase
MPHTEIIAEIGVNHDGSWTKALDLIDSAKKSGADTVKFQHFNSKLLKRPELQELELDLDTLVALKAHCKEVEIGFLCTPFDLGTLYELLDIGAERIKISSGKVTDLYFVKAVADTKLPVIMSTGMCTHEQMWAAYRLLGSPTVLQCTSSYPCPLEDVNLSVLDGLCRPFGLSDHTMGDIVAVAAVSRGASVIEKHFTLDRKAEGPDHRMSMMPDEFKGMVEKIRQVEVILGDGQKRPMPSEKEVMKLWR